jgi:hypothetical protein
MFFVCTVIFDDPQEGVPENSAGPGPSAPRERTMCPAVAAAAASERNEIVVWRRSARCGKRKQGGGDQEQRIVSNGSANVFLRLGRNSSR